jgi:hypothetical protein
MVVVEHAYKQIGSKVEVEFIRGLQTAAGKMMFAKLVNTEEKRAQKVVGRKATTVQKKQPVKAAKQATRQSAERLQPQQRRAQPTTPPSARQKRRQSPEDSMVELANRQ